MSDICGYIPHGLYGKYTRLYNKSGKVFPIDFDHSKRIESGLIAPVLFDSYSWHTLQVIGGFEVIPIAEVAISANVIYDKTLTLYDLFKKTNYYVELIDEIHRLKMDYRGLIAQGLAIDVHTLKNNPYS
jgi:hypothetical protein